MRITVKIEITFFSINLSWLLQTRRPKYIRDKYSQAICRNSVLSLVSVMFTIIKSHSHMRLSKIKAQCAVIVFGSKIQPGHAY